MGVTVVGDAGVGEGEGADVVGLVGMGRGAGVAGISVFSMEAAMESTCISISSSTEIVGVPTGGVRFISLTFLFGVTGLLLVSVFGDLFLFFFLPSRLAEA